MYMKTCPLSVGVSALLGVPAAHAITVTPTDSALTLVNSILGSGVSLVPGTAVLTGASGQAGTFANGGDAVPMNAGIVLSTGLVSQIPGPNGNPNPESLGGGGVANNDLSTDFGGAGASEIANSFDAVALQFDFIFGDGSVGGDLNFGFVFASEEYIDFVNSNFNDEFQLLINGIDVALVAGGPVNINNVNPVTNSAFYVNNVSNTNGYPVAGLNFKFDGRTTFLTASALGLGAGTHSARFVIADVTDGVLDSGVFIQAGSFNPDTPNPDGVIPLPATLPLLASAVALIAWRRRRT